MLSGNDLTLWGMYDQSLYVLCKIKHVLWSRIFLLLIIVVWRFKLMCYVISWFYCTSSYSWGKLLMYDYT